MKKVFALIAVAAMMLSCGGNGQNGTNKRTLTAAAQKSPSATNSLLPDWKATSWFRISQLN